MKDSSEPMQPSRPDAKIMPVSLPIHSRAQQQSELSFLLQLRRALKRELGRIEKRIDDLRMNDERSEDWNRK